MSHNAAFAQFLKQHLLQENGDNSDLDPEGKFTVAIKCHFFLVRICIFLLGILNEAIYPHSIFWLIGLLCSYSD